jgi:CubicO group peptidase (beta-lactamase class C family)
VLGDFDALVEEAMAEWQVSGLSIAILHGDETALLKAYGQRDVEACLPTTLQTQFAICSVTKSFTAAGLGMLVDERKLDWDAKVRDHIPEFRLHDPVASDRATLRDLLCHRTGLPRHDWAHMPGDLAPVEMLGRLQYLEPSREFRAQFQYQNLGYMAAGIVAERVSGQSWEAFTRARLLRPLGIEECEFLGRSNAAGGGCRAALYRGGGGAQPSGILADPSDGGGRHQHLDRRDGEIPALSARRRQGREEQLLSAASVRAMRTPRILESRSEFEEIGDLHYGFGLGCGHYRGNLWHAHGGGWIGWDL